MTSKPKHYESKCLCVLMRYVRHINSRHSDICYKTLHTNSRPQTSFVLASVSIFNILLRSQLFIYTYFTHTTEYEICFVIETLKYNKWILTIFKFHFVCRRSTRTILQRGTCDSYMRMLRKYANNLHRAKYNAERTAVCSPDSALNFVERYHLISKFCRREVELPIYEVCI